MKGFTPLLSGLLALGTAWADEPSGHVGPVTGISFGDERVYSCSQSGIFSGVGSEAKWLCDPGFRVTSLQSIPAGFFLSGGNPGESGNFAVYNFDTKDFSPNEKIADDMVYSMATITEFAFFAVEEAVRQFGGFGLLWRHRHTAAIRTVAVSPDEQFLASGGMDRVIILSERENPDSEISIQDHTAAVECLAFSPDSTRVVSGARDGKVRIHSVPDGKLVRTYHHLDGEVGAIAWNESRLLAGTSTGKIYQLDLASDASTVVADWGEDAPITALAIDPKGEVFAGTMNRIDQVTLDD